MDNQNNMEFQNNNMESQNQEPQNVEPQNVEPQNQEPQSMEPKKSKKIVWAVVLITVLMIMLVAFVMMLNAGNVAEAPEGAIPLEEVSDVVEDIGEIVSSEEVSLEIQEGLDLIDLGDLEAEIDMLDMDINQL
jgi:hypothetical protein